MSDDGRRLEINGASIYLDERGAGAPLILVHGGLGSGAEWAPLMELFADRFRVIVPDSRGHGRSTNPAGQLSYPALADDLAAVIDALGLDRPIVVGWSDGGQIALELAVRHAGTVAALVVGGAYPDFITSGLREVHHSLLGADSAGIPDLGHLDAELGDEADAIKALHRAGQGHWATLIAQTALMWLHYPGIPPQQIGAIGAPVLVLGGDRDEIIPLDLTVALYRALPNAELAIAPFADHSAPFTRNRVPVFAALICDFADRHRSTDSHQV